MRATGDAICIDGIVSFQSSGLEFSGKCISDGKCLSGSKESLRKQIFMRINGIKCSIAQNVLEFISRCFGKKSFSNRKQKFRVMYTLIFGMRTRFFDDDI